MRTCLAFLSIVVASAALYPADTPPPPLAATPLTSFRRNLALEPDRDWTYCWTRDGRLGLTWKFEGSEYSAWSLPQSNEWWESGYHGGVTATKAGNPTVDFGHGVELTLNVLKPPARRMKRINASTDSAAQIQKAIDAGYREIILEAGEHVLDRTVNLPAWTIVRGYGATLRRLARPTMLGEPDHAPHFQPSAFCSFYGCTFIHDAAGECFFTRTLAVVGTVVADCTFRRCGFGFFLQEVLVRDCRFDRAGAVIAPGGMWLRCDFRGVPPQHSWDYWAGQGAVAMIDCTFTDTDRGPVFNAMWGAIPDFFCSGLSCRNINQTPNGNEILLVEGDGAFDRPLILHTRVQSCQSAVIQLDRVARGGYVRDLFVDGGFGLCLWGDVSDWEVNSFELRNGAGVYCGPNCRDCRFIDGSVIGWMPGRYNQTFQNMSKLGLSRRTAAISEGTNNTMERVLFLGLGPEFKAQQGFVVK